MMVNATEITNAAAWRVIAEITVKWTMAFTWKREEIAKNHADMESVCRIINVNV